MQTDSKRVVLSSGLLMVFVFCWHPVRSEAELAVPHAITVCELFRTWQTPRPKMVAVRGIYWNGLRQRCPKPFITRDHEWPSALYLVDSGFASETGLAVEFKTNRESWNRLDEVTAREARAGHHEEIWVTIYGKLTIPETYIRSDGRVIAGFGHLGMFPAQLVVEHISDVVIKPTPTFNYGELVSPLHGQ